MLCFSSCDEDIRLKLVSPTKVRDGGFGLDYNGNKIYLNGPEEEIQRGSQEKKSFV